MQGWWIGLALMVACNAPCSQGIKVAAGAFLGVIEADGRGAYQQILHEATRRAGVNISESVYPLQRALNSFMCGDALAIYGMTESVIQILGKEKILTSYPLGIYTLYLFTRKGEPRITSFEQLKGKRVGGINGYQIYYRRLIQQGIDIHYFAKEEYQLKRLQLGRIDAVLGFLPDWFPYLDQLHYAADFPISQGFDAMTVHNTPAGRAFVDKISPALQQMHGDGTLGRLLGDRYMEFNYQPSESFQWGFNILAIQPEKNRHSVITCQ